MLESSAKIIEIAVGIISIFTTGFFIGKFYEKSSHEKKQLKKEIHDIQDKLSQGIKNDPELLTWLRDNAPNVTKLISKLTNGDNL